MQKSTSNQVRRSAMLIRDELAKQTPISEMTNADDDHTHSKISETK